VVALPTSEELQAFLGTLSVDGMLDGGLGDTGGSANPWEEAGVALGNTKGGVPVGKAGSATGVSPLPMVGSKGGSGSAHGGAAQAAPVKGVASASGGTAAPAAPTKGGASAGSGSGRGGGNGAPGKGGEGAASADLHSMRARPGARGRRARLPVEGALGKALVAAGLWDWQDHAGSKLADVPLSVETSPEWSRKYFLPAQPLACARVYAAANDGAQSTMDRVVASIEDFLPRSAPEGKS